MGLRIGVYAPDLTRGPQPAPLRCLRDLFDNISKRDGIDVVHLYRGDPLDWDDSIHIPRIPIIAEKKINNSDIDIIHFGSFVNIVTPKLIEVPTILRYHGDVYWEMPGTVNSTIGDHTRRILDTLFLPQHDQIVTVSNDLATRVKSRYSRLSDCVATVYNGIDSQRFSQNNNELPEEYMIESPYILHISSYSNKKNPRGILKSFKKVKNQMDVNLVVVGGGWKDNKQVQRFIESSNIADRVTLTGYVPDKHLPSLYQNSELFLYPSLHETFGLPIVEAMACGTPVVTSNIYSPPEIAGGAAVTCDPSDPSDIADGIKQILTDHDLREALIEQGLSNSKQYTWENAADEMIEIYQKVM